MSCFLGHVLMEADVSVESIRKFMLNISCTYSLKFIRLIYRRHRLKHMEIRFFAFVNYFLRCPQNIQMKSITTLSN